MLLRRCWLFVVAVLLTVLVNGQALAAEGLREGTSGMDVMELQERLESLNYDVGEADGVFGQQTAEAVKSFQRDYGLDADGVIGRASWDTLVRLTPEVSRRASRLGDRTVYLARQYMGVPYVFGGSSPSGFDCSGFVQYVYRQLGIYLPRAADDQYDVGASVDSYNLQAGDLVYFSTYTSGVSHVGIYIGNSYFIHASTRRGVTVSSLNEEYYSSCYVGAKRVLR